MSQQQIIVQPLGLITQPNKLGTFPPGALQNAEGIYLRDPNLVEVAQFYSSGYTASPPTTLGAFQLYLFPAPPNAPTQGVQYTLQTWLGANYLYSWLNSSGTNNGAQNLINSEGAFQSISPLGRMNSIAARGRQFINCNQPVLAFDHGAGANPTPRTAGMLPVTIARTSGSGASGALPAGNQCHHSAVIRRKFSDGYEIISAPSAAVWQYNGTGTIAALVYLNSAYHKAGDIVDLYRTISQNESTNSGANFYLVASHTVTAADIASGNFTLQDNTNDATMGDSLYTNPGAQTAAGAANPPPTCKIMVMFKGHALYLNCIDPPQRKLAVGVFMGSMGDGATGANAYARTYGIGSRTVRATVTVGNATVTAVPAADIVGLKIGQRLEDFRFPNPSFVTAIGATTVTFNNVAVSGAGAANLLVDDSFEVDGTSFRMGSANDFSSLPGAFGITYPFVTQLLDRILPEDFGAGFTNPETVFADGAIISRWFLADSRLGSMTLRATNGTNYVPPIPELVSGTPVETVTQTVRLNGASWSEQNQPERVCPGSTIPVGSGEIYAAFSTRDAVWIFASDGLWRWSGTGGSAGDGYDWRVDPVDSTLSIAGPMAGCVLRDTVYAYTNRGFVSIDSSGNIKELSQGRLNDLLPGPQWSLPSLSTPSIAMWMVADETHDEILFTSNLTINGISYVYVYNLLTDAFTRLICGSSVLGNISVSGANGNYPSHAAYVRQGEAVIFTDRSSSPVLCQTPNSWGPHFMQTQPVYADNPFNLRHWQTLNFVFQDGGVTQTIVPFINALSTPAGVTTLFGSSGHARLSCTIPRNAPAIANQIAVGFFGAGPNSTQRRLMAMELDYVDLTDQRRKR